MARLVECDHCLSMFEIVSPTAIKAWCSRCCTEHAHLIREFNIDPPGFNYSYGTWSRDDNIKKLAKIPKYDNIVT